MGAPSRFPHTLAAAAALLPIVFGGAPAAADSSSPLLAAYYDRQMAVVDGAVYAWQGEDAPQRVAVDAVQVGVGRHTYFALDKSGRLIAFRGDLRRPETVMTGVTSFAAGRSGVLAVSADGALSWIARHAKVGTRIATGVVAAAVGDGANYYVTKAGALFVRGRAHRGQYGDGRLETTAAFVQTASTVARIRAHTGHAILLTRNGDVLGTGGNIYGPVGKHGLGDKAVRWSRIMTGATAVATGSSHTVAIRHDGTLVAWGDGYGTEPVPVMAEVEAAAAGSSTTIALRRDGTLWQWDRGAKPRILALK